VKYIVMYDIKSFILPLFYKKTHNTHIFGMI
jgi:hypothetical protein